MNMHRSPRFDEPPMLVGDAFKFDFPREFRALKGLLGNGKIEDKIGELAEDDFLLDSKEYRGVEFDDNTGAFFVEDPELSYGREESGHGVFFGQLTVESARDGDSPELVAIKPFDFAQDAIHEYGVMTRLNNIRGAQHRRITFNPIGFCALTDGNVGLISVYEHDVQSYDNLFWNPETTPSPKSVSQALRNSGFALGAVQNLGFTQGDPQIKNMARGNQGPRIIDVEESRPFPTNVEGREEQIFEATLQDVRILVDSLFPPGVESDGRYDQQVIDDFLPTFLKVTHLPTSRIPLNSRIGINQARSALSL